MHRNAPEPEHKPPARPELPKELGGLEGICRETIAASPFGVLVHDPAGKVLLFNARLEQITGYAASEIPDLATWLRLIYPFEQYRSIVAAEPSAKPSPGEPRIRYSMVTHRGGRMDLCQLTSRPLESGLCVEFVQPLEDPIGPEEENRARRFPIGCSPLPCLYWIRQADDFILTGFNRAARKLLGDEIGQALGRPNAEVFSSIPGFFAAMRRCLEAKTTLSEDLRIEGPGAAPGRAARCIFEYAGDRLVMVQLQDLSAANPLAAGIEQVEARFRQMLDLLPETVFEMDPAGRILFLNSNGYERFGVTPEDIERGFYPIENLTPEDRTRGHQNLAKVMGGSYSGPNEYVAILKDGNKAIHLASSRPVVIEGRIVGLCGVIVDVTERRKLQAELRDNEERLRLATEAARIGIHVTDLETGDRQWSPEMYALMGLQPGSRVTDEQFQALIHPEDRARVLEIHRRVNAPDGSGNIHSEHRIVRPDGEVRWVACQGRTFFRETGSGRAPARMLGTCCIDITDRKAAEIALQLSEKRLSQIFHSNPHGMAITTFGDGRYLEVNCAECAMTGHSREDLIGRSSVEMGFFVNPQDRREIVRRLFTDLTVNNYKLRFRRKSGEIRWGYISATLMEFEGQRCILSTVSDATETHRSEEAVRISEERLRVATESASVGWWELDIRNNRVICNDVFYTMLGYTPQEFPISFDTWKTMIFPVDLDRLIPLLGDMLSGRGLHFRSEYRIRKKNGDWLWVQDTARVVERGKGGRPARLIGVLIDIHERKLFEEKLFRDNRELEERVKTRTADLEALNENLRAQIAARSRAEQELIARSEELSEINSALRVVLRNNREELDEFRAKTADQIRQLAFPHLEKLKLARLAGRESAYVQLLGEALSQIASQDASALSELQRKLTPAEFQVAGLIRQGHTSKQISEIMSISCLTIESHRKSIRKKLGLCNSKANLRNHLSSLS